jgi:hypothetical protein
MQLPNYMSSAVLQMLTYGYIRPDAPLLRWRQMLLKQLLPLRHCSSSSLDDRKPSSLSSSAAACPSSSILSLPSSLALLLALRSGLGLQLLQ